MEKKSETKAEVTVERDLEKENAALMSDVEKLVQKNEKLSTELAELKKEKKKASSEKVTVEVEKKDTVVLNGVEHKIIRVELAKDFMDLVKKKFVDEDQTCVVIDRTGY